MIEIKTEGDPVAGLNYSIVCRASAGVNSSTLPSVTWLAPDGTDLQAVSTNRTSITYAQEGYFTIVTLQFHPLSLHHGGVYECLASILDTQGATSTGRSRQQTLLTVQSEHHTLPISSITLSGHYPPQYLPHRWWPQSTVWNHCMQALHSPLPVVLYSAVQ